MHRVCHVTGKYDSLPPERGGRKERIMERLTYEIIDGGIVTDRENVIENEIEDGIKVCGGAAILRLSQYEDTELTPEEIRELAERNKSKMPRYEGDGYSDGEMVYDTWFCPNCGAEYEVDYDDYDFCPECGQRILR